MGRDVAEVDGNLVVLVALLGVSLLALLAFLSISRQEPEPRTEAVTLERDDRGRIVGVVRHG